MRMTLKTMAITCAENLSEKKKNEKLVLVWLARGGVFGSKFGLISSSVSFRCRSEFVAATLKTSRPSVKKKC